MNVTLTELFATIGRYLLTIEVSDVLDIAIMAFALASAACAGCGIMVLTRRRKQQEEE